MPDAIDTIIANSIEDLGGSDAAPEPIAGAVAAPVEVPAVADAVPAAVDAVVAPDAPVAVVAPPVADLTDAEKALEEVGIRAPKEGERENRIPYTRTVKIIENALKKQTATHTTALTAETVRYAELEKRTAPLLAAEEMASKDPDRYMQVLATIDPRFAAYKKQDAAAPAVAAPAAVAAVPAVDLGPKPGPDIKFSDGSVGYSPEQMDRKDDWLTAKARQDAAAEYRKDMDARLSPFEEERKTAKERQDADKAHNAKVTSIRQQVQDQRDLWGDDYPKADSAEEKAVTALMTSDKTISLAKALKTVIQKKWSADREAVRTDVLKEVNTRAAGAQKAAPAAAKAVVDPAAPRDINEIIRESIQALKNK